tara:strand:- start:12 stop:677 length:666 start_codon:yes stop_codon:yes gene_type:complete
MFKKNKHVIIKQVISKDLATFIANYFVMKKQVYDTCLKQRFISPYEVLLGGYEGKNSQVPNTYASYADIVMETLLLKCQPIMEKTTGLKLNPAYSFARIYKKGDILYRHRDRFSCEISTTMNLGGDSWPIYLDPTGERGIESGHDQTVKVKPNANKGIKIDLRPGDMLVYKGCELDHWRNKFKGKECIQVFLHYNNPKTPGAKDNMFDKRLHLGLPSWFKR